MPVDYGPIEVLAPESQPGPAPKEASRKAAEEARKRAEEAAKKAAKQAANKSSTDVLDERDGEDEREGPFQIGEERIFGNRIFVWDGRTFVDTGRTVGDDGTGTGTGGGSGDNGGSENGNQGSGGESGLQIGDTRMIDGVLHMWNGTAFVPVENNNTTGDPAAGTGFVRDPNTLRSEQAQALADQIVDQGFAQADVAEAGVGTDEGAFDVAAGTGQISDAALTDVTGQQLNIQDPSEKVSTISDDQIAQATTPTGVPAATVTAEEIDPSDQVQVQTAQIDALSDQAIIDNMNIASVQKINPADVKVEEGAVAERVVGTLSDGAIADAAKITGLSVRRITRAKEQLRNAGISETVINSLGDDPTVLEDALLDLTDEERGLVEGLPQQALVSNQMSSLLEGIEDGEIPAWARPAVSKVEELLAQRGLSASSVGRDNLFNAIIQSALPIAQSNAQAIQASVAQERETEARVAIQEAQFKQQTSLQNAQNIFNLDITQFNADQQRELSNSKFFQTISLTEANNEQQAAIQDAVLMSQRNIAEADLNTKRQINNAKSFLQKDLTNISLQQQSFILQAQQEQQVLLSNQAARNAAEQFNASSENQTNQFMADLNARIDISNVQQENAIRQFNSSQENAAEARRVQNQIAIDSANAKLLQDADLHNSQIEYNRQQFNEANALVIAQSNAQWRRQINLANTAAQNAVNQQNAQNLFNLNTQANSFIWQELRDNADRDWKAWQNERNREADILMTALSTENGSEWVNSRSSLSNLINLLSGSAGSNAGYENPYNQPPDTVAT
jgi:hypothetical protein